MNIDNSSERTLEVLAACRDKFSKFFDQDINGSAVYVDLADIYEISSWYINKMNVLLDSKEINRDELWEHLTDIQVQFFEHLAHHLDSLEVLLPRLIKMIEHEDQ